MTANDRVPSSDGEARGGVILADVGKIPPQPRKYELHKLRECRRLGGAGVEALWARSPPTALAVTCSRRSGRFVVEATTEEPALEVVPSTLAGSGDGGRGRRRSRRCDENWWRCRRSRCQRSRRPLRCTAAMTGPGGRGAVHRIEAGEASAPATMPRPRYDWRRSKCWCAAAFRTRGGLGCGTGVLRSRARVCCPLRACRRATTIHRYGSAPDNARNQRVGARARAGRRASISCHAGCRSMVHQNPANIHAWHRHAQGPAARRHRLISGSSNTRARGARGCRGGSSPEQRSRDDGRGVRADPLGGACLDGSPHQKRTGDIKAGVGAGRPQRAARAENEGPCISAEYAARVRKARASCQPG